MSTFLEIKNHLPCPHQSEHSSSIGNYYLCGDALFCFTLGLGLTHIYRLIANIVCLHIYNTHYNYYADQSEVYEYKTVRRTLCPALCAIGRRSNRIASIVVVFTLLTIAKTRLAGFIQIDKSVISHCCLRIEFLKKYIYLYFLSVPV